MHVAGASDDDEALLMQQQVPSVQVRLQHSSVQSAGCAGLVTKDWQRSCSLRSMQVCGSCGRQPLVTSQL